MTSPIDFHERKIADTSDIREEPAVEPGQRESDLPFPSAQEKKLSLELISYIFLSEEGSCKDGQKRVKETAFRPFILDGVNFVKKKKVLSDSDIEKLHLTIQPLEQFFHWHEEIDQFNSEYKEALEERKKELEKNFLQELSKKIGKAVATLEIGKSLLIPGGFVGSSGCSMAYEIKLEERGYRIVIINTADNGTYHCSNTTERKKEVSPYLVFSNLPKEKLFPNEGYSFFSELLVPLLEIDREQEKDLSEQEIYNGSFRYLKEYLNGDHPLTETYQTAQRSKNSSWKVLLAYLRMQLPKNSYKKLHFYLRLTALGSFDERFEKEEGDATWYKKALQKLFKEASNKRSSGILSDRDIKELEELEQSILTNLDDDEAIQRDHSQEKGRLAGYLQDPAAHSLTERFGSMSDEDVISLLMKIKISSDKDHEHLPHRLQFFSEEPKADQSVRQIARLSKGMQSCYHDNSFPYYQYLVDRYVEQIPINSSFWTAIPKDRLSNAIEAFSDLLFEYHRITVSKDQNSTPARANTALAIHVILFELCKRKNEDYFSTEKEFFTPFNFYSLIKNNFFLPLEKTQRDRYQELFQYFEESNGIECFCPYEWRELPPKEEGLKDPEALFFKNLYEKNPELQERVKTGKEEEKASELSKGRKDPFPAFKDIDDKVIDIAFLSNDLSLIHDPSLREWVKSIYLTYAFFHPVDTPAFFTRQLEKDGWRKGFPTKLFTLTKTGYLDKTARSPCWRLGPNNERKHFASLFPDLEICPHSADNPSNKRKNLLGMELPPLECPTRATDRYHESLSQISSLVAVDQLKWKTLLSFGEQVVLFESQAIQTQFWLQLFKTSITYEEVTIASTGENKINHYFDDGLHETFKKNPSLTDDVIKFVQKGLSYFIDADVYEHPQIGPGCFFFRFAVQTGLTILDDSTKIPEDSKERYRTFMKNLEKRYLIDGIPSTLTDKKMAEHYTSSDKALFYLHRLHFAIFFHAFKDLNAGEVISDWVAIQQLKIKKDDRADFLKDAVTPRMMDYLVWLRRRVPDWSLVFPKIIEKCELPSTDKELSCSYSNALILTGENEERTYRVDLFSGDVWVDNVLTSYPFYIGQENPHYKFIVGDHDVQIKSIGSRYFFFHPEFGTVQVQNGDFKNGVQVKFADTHWYQLIPYETLVEKRVLPLELVHGHLHWVRVDQGWIRTAVITKRENPTTVLYTIDGQKGLVRSKDQQRIYHFDNLPSIKESLGVLSDQNRQILIYDRDGNFSQISIPSLRSIEDRSFVLYRKTVGENGYTNEWYWSDDFQVCATGKVGLIGNLDQYVRVKHPFTGEEKILITIADFKEADSFSVKLDIQDDRLVDANFLRKESKKESRYLTFKVKDNSLIPEDIEGHIYLAYLYLGAREYEKAFTLIDQLSEGHDLTDRESKRDIAMKWLEKTVFLPIRMQSYPPNAVAISLHAALKYFSHGEKDSSPSYPREEFFRKVSTIYHTYLDRLSLVSPTFLLTEEEEIFLLKTMEKYSASSVTTTKRREFLTNRRKENEEKYLFSDPSFSEDWLSMPTFEWVEKHLEIDLVAKQPFDQKIDVPDLILHASRKIFTQQEILSFFNYGMDLIDQEPPATLSSEERGNWQIQQKQKKEEVRFLIFPLLTNPRGNDKVTKIIPLLLLLHLLALSDGDQKNAVRLIKSARRDGFNHPLKKAYQEHIVNKLQSSSTDAQRVVREIPPPMREFALQGTKTPLLLEPPKEEPSPVTKKIQREERDSLLPAWLEKVEDANGRLIQVEELKLPQETISLEDLKQIPDAFSYKNYATVIEQEVEKVIEEVRSGKKQLPTEKYTITAESANLLEASLRNTLSEHLDIVRRIEKNILGKLNKVSLKNRLAVKAGQKLLLTMDRVEKFYLVSDNKGLQRAALCDLSDEEIDQIMQEVTKWEIEEIEHLRLLKALSILQLLTKDDLSEEDRENLSSSFVQHVNEDLSHFFTEEDENYLHVLLVFSRRSGLITRKSQWESVQHILPGMASCVVDETMGSGKTSVLMALAAYFHSHRPGQKEKKLAVLYVTEALLKSVKSALTNSQKTSFDQEVFTLNYSTEMFQNLYEGIAQLEQMKRRLEKGREKGDLLIMTPSTLQMLNTEAINAFNDWLTNQNLQASKILKEKSDLLQEITTFFQRESIGIIDEVDTNIDSKREVNLAVGKPSTISANRLSHVQNIFEILCSDPFRDKIRLHENGQTLLSESEWEELIPQIAERIFKSTEIGGKLGPKFIGPFKKFVCRDFDPSKKEEGDFLDNLYTYYESEDPSDRELVEIISLSKYLLQVTLPQCFLQSVGRHFGRHTNGSSDEVVPYEAVGVPATTRFGNKIEAIVKQYMTALVTGISKQQLLNIASRLKKAAQHSSVILNRHISETAQATLFHEKTGLTLAQIDNDQEVEAALRRINSDFQSSLAVESETALECVITFPDYISSTGQDLGYHVGVEYGMSGTTWNKDSFPEKLASNLFKREGAEGKIIQTILQRADQTKIHAADPSDLDQTLETIYDEKAPFQALFDPGALFKDYRDYQVAEKLYQFHEEKGVAPQAVLFFQSNRLAALMKKGDQFEVIYLSGTKEIDLKKKGLSIAKCITYLSGQYTTGTDLPFHRGCRAIVTADEKILHRTLLQTVMRLRQFLTTQKADFLISTDLKSKAPINQNLLLLLLQIGIANQAKQLADSMKRSQVQMYEAAIRERFRASLGNQRISQDPHAQEIYSIRAKVYNSFIYTSMKEDLTLLYLGKENEIETLQYLKQFRERLEKQLRNKIETVQKETDPKLFQKTLLEEDLKAIQDEFNRIANLSEKKRGLLPSKAIERTLGKRAVSSSLEENLGLELEQHQQMQQEQQIDLEHERNIVEEFSKYQIPIDKPLGTVEHPWRQYLSKFLHKLVNPNAPDQEYTRNLSAFGLAEKIGQKIISLSELFTSEDLHKSTPEEYARFAKIFSSDEIFASRNFRHIKQELLPVFHQMQRLGYYILAAKQENNKYIYILLSADEALDFRDTLNEEQRNGELLNIWLITPTGNSFLRRTLPKEEMSKMKRAFTEMLIFSGHISTLFPLNLLEEAKRWLQDPDTFQERHDYLNLRVKQFPSEQACLDATGLLNNKKFGIDRYLQDYAASEEEITEERIQEIQRFDQWEMRSITPKETEYIKPEQVEYLPPNKIKFLQTKEQIQSVPTNKASHLIASQIEHVTVEQAFSLKSVNCIRAIPSSTLDAMITIANQENPDTRAQKSFIHLHIRTLSENQLQGLKNEKWLDHFTVDQWRSLDEDMLKKILHTKVQSVDSMDLHKLPDLLLVKMSDFQWKDLNDERIKEISNETVLNKLRKERLNKISPKVVDKLTDEKLQELSCPSLINSVPPERWVHLSIHQLRQLEESRIHGIGFEKKDINLLVSLLDISPELIAKFHHEHLPLVIDAIKEKKPDNDKEIFQAITSAQLEKYPKECTHILPVETFGKLPEERLGDLTEDQLNYIKDSTLLNRLPTKQIHLLKIPGQISSLNNEKFKEISYDQIETLETKEDIQRLDADQLKHTRSDQFIHLTDEQLKKLTLSQIQTIDNKDLINRLDADLVNLLQQDQLLLLDEDRLQDLSPTQLQSITNPDLLQKLKKDEVKKLLPTQFEDLTDGQLKDLTIDQLQQIENRKVAQRLPQESIQHLEPGQVQYLADTQIEYFSVEKIDRLAREILPTILPHMTDEQKENLSEEQIQSLEGEESISHLVGANISHLKNRQLVHLTADLMPHASCSQKMIRIFLLCFLPLFNLIAALFHWLTCGTLRSNRREPISA